MLAIDAEYHLIYLVKFYHRVRTFDSNDKADNFSMIQHGIAFGELTSYLRQALDYETIVPVFYLKALYSSRLKQLWLHDETIHSTWLKNHILSIFPELSSHKE